jgi:hypothetical protein
MKNHKIAEKPTTTKVREKISTDLESFKFYNSYVFLTQFKNNQILPNKISHRFLLTIKLFTGRNSLIEKQPNLLLLVTRNQGK